MITEAANIETTFRSPDVFPPHFLKESTHCFHQNENSIVFPYMEFPFQNSIVFPEFHSLYEPWGEGGDDDIFCTAHDIDRIGFSVYSNPKAEVP